MAAWTRARVAGATAWGRLSTLLTVPIDTPARAATSSIVAMVGSVRETLQFLVPPGAGEAAAIAVPDLRLLNRYKRCCSR
ncbi:hypothetical protein Acy02nite_50730 [Actinoplanes cyaneus]|uniref:Uncharacterized protein n=1 Tax=Actinoplanes cyaneus TaxID=52696 RepID=A0A919M5Z6_9ACTN|nr:hypothetical protein Acy02nite_50730 [Actinoplanes cyaneus]